MGWGELARLFLAAKPSPEEQTVRAKLEDQRLRNQQFNKMVGMLAAEHGVGQRKAYS